MKNNLKILISIALLMIILLSGCSLFSRKTFDKKLGNNREAADCARIWQEKAAKEDIPQKWRVELLPVKGGELRGRNLEQYRKKVTDVEVTVKLTGKSITKWQKAIERKKELPNPYLPWPDGWLENTVKQLATPRKRNQESLHVYPRADVTLTLMVKSKVGAIAKYDASTKATSLEVHY